MKNTPEPVWDGDPAERAAGLSEEEKRLLQELEENEKALWEILFEGLWDALPKHEDHLRRWTAILRRKPLPRTFALRRRI